ncbi:hypothetical protein QQ045_006720 [Rhodiola kirilowii]
MRLDRALINGAALAMLPNLSMEHLPRISFDHASLLTKFREAMRTPASFKYIRAWHEHTDFLALVEDEWPKHSHTNPILALALKLKVDALEIELQQNWHPRLENAITRTKDQLATAQRLHYQVLADKAKAQWVADGDRNTTLFHALIKARRAKNRAHLEMADGSFTENHTVIGKLALDHFKDILGSYSVCPPLDAFDDVLPSINDLDNDKLTSIPDEDEVHQAVKSLNPSSAPGPDGFTVKLN